MPRLFYESRTTLYANCRGEVAGDPPLPTGSRRWRGRRRAAGGRRSRRGRADSREPGGRGGPEPAAGCAARSDPGLYKLEDKNGDDVMDTIERMQGYTRDGMGDHGPHAIRRAPGREHHVPHRQQHLRRGATSPTDANDNAVDKESLAELAQRRGAPVPAAVQRSAVRQQHAHRRARDGVAPPAEQQVQPVLQRHAQSVRLRLQPRRRGVHVRQRHGMGRQLAVVSRGADRFT